MKPNSFNPKRTERFKDETRRLATSLEKFGQVLPLLVRELSDGSFEILNGFHRYQALLEKNGEEQTVDVWSVGSLSDQKAKALVLSLEDSRIPLNRLKVAQLVNSISKKDWLPYSPEDIRSLEVLSGIDFSLPPEKSSSQEKPYKVLLPKEHWDAWDEKRGGLSDGEFVTELLKKSLK